MNKAVESVLVVVAAVGLYAGLPVLMIWGAGGPGFELANLNTNGAVDSECS